MARLGLQLDLLERAYIFDLRVRQRQMRRQRHLFCPFDLPDNEFISTYRLPKTLAEELINELQPFMSPRRSGDISIENKILTTLNFYASGSYQRGVGQNSAHSISQSSVSKAVREVTVALNHISIRNKYIKFPQNAAERNQVKKEFYEAFHFPGVIGCVDGTHIALIRPRNNEERYYNRKKYHSINAQLICDANLNILSVDASHGGATHDSFIWNGHPVKQHLENLYNNGNETLWILADTGYPLRTCAMTPILHAASGSREEYYTYLHIRARNCIERCIGVLKARWRCLLVHRVLHYEPELVGYIINACVVLHNIANRARLPVPELSPVDLQRERALQDIRTHAEENIEGTSTALVAGRAVRETLVDRLWAERGVLLN